ncbi:hypothetical protein ABZ863_07750 [Saccharomonospora sp. NPDC046836]|uniref:hypothetical protein n=1 Tax=Saccharomonospora sp. NPDC046836 TaxID=3156921 RepID=UPI0033CE33E2
MSWREWLGLGAGLLALGSLFLPWTVLTASSPDVQAVLAELPDGDVTRSAWNSTFFAWFPPLLLLATGIGVAALGHVQSVRRGGLPQLWLVAAAVALLSSVLGWMLIDWQFGGDERVLLADAGVTVAAGAGRYLGLLAVLVSFTAAILDVRAARTEARKPRRRR